MNEDELSGLLQKTLTSIAGRVAVALSLLLVPAITAGCVWLQDVIGINLSPGEVQAFVATLMLGGFAAVSTWVFNKGRFERAMLDIYKLYQQGKGNLPTPEPAVVVQGPNETLVNPKSSDPASLAGKREVLPGG